MRFGAHALRLLSVGLKWSFVYSFSVMFFTVCYFVLPANSFHQGSLESDSLNRAQLTVAGELLALDLTVDGLLRELNQTADPDTFSLLECRLSFAPHQQYVEADVNAYLPVKDAQQVNRLYTVSSARVYVGNRTTLLIAPERKEFGASIFGDTLEHVSYGVGSDTRAAISELVQLQNDVLPKDFATFVKLLYFSGVTAATIGYGDITPISTVARLLAAVQAIASIVMLGMFINALGQTRLGRD